MEINNLIDYAIKHGTIKTDVLVKMILCLDDDVAKRFTEAILGIVDVDAFMATIPAQSFVSGREAKRVGYNYLTDNVAYTYDEEITRYFKTSDEAQIFTNGGFYCWSGNEEMTEEYQFEAKHVFHQTSYCCLDTWMEGAKGGRPE